MRLRKQPPPKKLTANIAKILLEIINWSNITPSKKPFPEDAVSTELIQVNKSIIKDEHGVNVVVARTRNVKIE